MGVDTRAWKMQCANAEIAARSLRLAPPLARDRLRETSSPGPSTIWRRQERERRAVAPDGSARRAPDTEHFSRDVILGARESK